MQIKNLTSDKLMALLSSLSNLHAWELKNMPFMQTTTGQHLYYELAPLTMGRGPQIEQPLKQVYTSSPFTERALRIRMKEMANQGLLATCSVSPDGRNKSLMPTEKFQNYVYDHAREAHWLLNEKFHLLERD